MYRDGMLHKVILKFCDNSKTGLRNTASGRENRRRAFRDKCLGSET